MAAATRGGSPKGRAVRRALPLLQLLFFAALSPFLTTCGIETVTTLQPPGFISPSTNLLQLTHNTANSASTLKGYRFTTTGIRWSWWNLKPPDTARQAIEAAIGRQNATPETCLSLMQSLGFTRIFDGDGNDGPNGIRPLFEMPTTSLSTALQYNIFLDTTPPASSVSSAATDLVNGPSMAGNPVPYWQTVPYWYFYLGTSTTHYGITRSISTVSAPVSFESTYAANSTTTGDYTGAGQWPTHLSISIFSRSLTASTQARPRLHLFIAFQ